MDAGRQKYQDLFIKVCKDSGFTLDMYRAAALVGAVFGTTALDVYCKMDVGLDTMIQIANGTHPVVQTKEQPSGS